MCVIKRKKESEINDSEKGKEKYREIENKKEIKN